MGNIGAGDVMLFVAAIAGSQAAVTRIAAAIAGMHRHLLLFGHYLEVLAAEPDLPSPDVPHPLPALRRGIELRDVWFRYSEHHPWVLRGVNAFIPHGQAVALVGRNGSGKSTLIKLLCRFYDPTKGAILWDGIDIRETSAEELRRNITAVFQDFMHYDMTAAENIGLGDTDALGDEVRIERAAALAGVHQTLAGLPHGYQTLLTRMFAQSAEDATDSGVQLSGGQWQRVALARALVRSQRDLIILDEPGSGLDAAAEHEVHQRLRDHRAGRTSLLISHRLGSVRDADLILVLSHGELIERGTHTELIARDGEYALLFRLQSNGYVSAETGSLTGDRA
jgi:ATP-binding cassette subfamily B protein